MHATYLVKSRSGQCCAAVLHCYSGFESCGLGGLRLARDVGGMWVQCCVFHLEDGGSKCSLYTNQGSSRRFVIDPVLWTTQDYSTRSTQIVPSLGCTTKSCGHNTTQSSVQYTALCCLSCIIGMCSAYRARPIGPSFLAENCPGSGRQYRCRCNRIDGCARPFQRIEHSKRPDRLLQCPASSPFRLLKSPVFLQDVRPLINLVHSPGQHYSALSRGHVCAPCLRSRWRPE